MTARRAGTSVSADASTAPLTEGGPELAQKCCAIEGLTQLLSRAPGSFRVVVHSEPDCANLVVRDAGACDPSRFLCTNLTEADVIAGRSRARLAEALAVAAGSGADTLFVLGGCVAGLAGDDVAEIVRAARLPPATRVVAIGAGAFRMLGQAAILDHFTGAMVEGAPRRRRRTRRSVNLVGFTGDGGETAVLLARAGIAVNAWPQLDSPAGVWRALPAAALTVISERRVFGRLAAALETVHGMPVIEVAPPAGVAGTEAFHRAIASRFGAERAASRAIRGARDGAARVLARFRRRTAGRRLAYQVGGRKDFALHTVVREGLTWVGAFAEMGYDVELLFQGAVEDAARRRIAAVLARYGIDRPFRPHPDRVSLTGALREGGFTEVYCCDSLRGEAGAAGVPVIPAGSMRPGFAGVHENIFLIRALSAR